MKPLRTCLATALILLCAASAAWACRIVPIWPPHPPVPHPPPPPLGIETKSHRFDIDIRDNTAQVAVEAVFFNPNGFQIEGTYFFPVEKDAVFRNFSMWVNGKEYKADLLPADQARQIYEDIVRRRKDPALLEYMGSGIIRCRIFPIEPRSDVRVKLSYTQVLRTDGGLTHLRYPLRSAKPDEGRIGTLSGKITLHTSRPLRTVNCPTHKVDIKRPDDRTAILGLEESGTVPDRDLRLFFGQSDADVEIGLIADTEPGEDGYFLLTIAPSRRIEDAKVLPKNIVFTVDTSGSMSGEKIRQARDALKFCLRSLNPADTFNVVPFSTSTNPMFRQMIEASKENVELALKRVDGIEAGGGTAIDEALAASLKMLADRKGLDIIVFVTDGLPTIGETDIGRILKNVRSNNTVGARIFAFGVGYDVNTDLLDGVATQNSGTQEYVGEKEDLEIKVSSLYAKIANPVLSDVKLDVKGVDISDTYPRRLPDLFKGGELSVLGRYRGDGKAAVSLSGTVNGEPRTMTWDLDFPKRVENDFLPSIWAFRKVAYLLEEIRMNGVTDELRDEVIRLGKRYGIMTPYTSFLVVEESEARHLGLENRRREFEAAKSGRGGVSASRTLSEAKEAAPAAPGMTEQFDMAGFTLGVAPGEKAAADMDSLRRKVEERMMTVRDKTFYLNRKDGVFYDSTYSEATSGKPIEIKWYSDEFFKLLKDVPELGKYLFETDNLVICYQGKSYRFVK